MSKPKESGKDLTKAWGPAWTAFSFVLGILLTLAYSNSSYLAQSHVRLIANSLYYSREAIERLQCFVLPLLPPEVRVQYRNKAHDVTLHPLFSVDENNEDLSALYSSYGCPPNHYNMIIVSRDPLIVYFENFLSPAEIKHILKIGVPKFARSTVVSDSGDKVSDYRTSFSAYLARSEDAVVQCIEQRAAFIQGNVPLHNIEPLQLVRYSKLQQYKGHYDWFSNVTDGDRSELIRGKQRTTSFFAYLFSNCTAGETAFTTVYKSKEELQPFCDFLICDEDSYRNPKPHIPSGSEHYEELSRGLRFLPKVGNAVFWYNVNLRNEGDTRTLHSGLPLSSGEKIAMNIWTRQEEFV